MAQISERNNDVEQSLQWDQCEYVRELAYRLWEQAGRPQGQSERFWKEAEEELRHRPDGRSVQEVVSGRDELIELWRR